MADNNTNWQVVLIRDGEIYGYMDEPNVYARHMFHSATGQSKQGIEIILR